MKTYDSKFLEEQLSKRINKKVTISRDGIYSSDEMALYKKIFVEGKYSGVLFDLEDLTEYEARGILSSQLDKLAAKLNNGE